MTNGNEHQEIWKNIPNFSRYEVSCCGLIRRAVKMRTRRKHSLLTPSPDDDGYLRVTVYNDSGKQEARGVHQLVARAFLPPPINPLDIFVLHKNDLKSDNNYLNLKWGNPKQNMQDAIKNGCLLNKKPRIKKIYSKQLSATHKAAMLEGFRSVFPEKVLVAAEFCQCGCGFLARAGSKFIHGHAGRVRFRQIAKDRIGKPRAW